MLNYQRVPSIIKNKPVVKGVLSNPSFLINQWEEDDIYVTWGDGNLRIQLMELRHVSTIFFRPYELWGYPLKFRPKT